MPYAITSTQYVAVASASAKFTNAMDPGKQYEFRTSTNCWVKVTVTGGAAAADTANNIYVAAGGVLYLANPDTSIKTNAFVHVIRDSADGDATLARIDSV